MFADNKKIMSLVAGAAALASAQSPPDFSPGSDTAMLVAFGTTGAMEGVVVDQDDTSTAPTIGLFTIPTSQNLAILMIDLDIPTSINPDGLSTVLHWLQCNLTASSTTTTLTFDTGEDSVEAYLLENAAGADPIAEYTSPNPPAMNPLSHRYTQVVMDVTDVDAEGLSVLAAAAETRLGFDAVTVLEQAGITEAHIIAGNFFNVTNPGPAEDEEGSTEEVDDTISAGNDTMSGCKCDNGSMSGGHGGNGTMSGGKGGNGTMSGGKGGNGTMSGGHGGNGTMSGGKGGNGTMSGGGNGTASPTATETATPTDSEATETPTDTAVPVSHASGRELGTTVFAGLLLIAGAFLAL